ncbi:tyrosine-type recombinase/integrase [Xanthomonas sp. WHRI 1810A]|uniref:tyrosine-type recombinase/integrase n=1 Tax=Xanthomonas sp. WHRI 1810A TaxID=3161565 RepID=UPI0032E8E122
MATHLVRKPGESAWYVRMAVPVEVRHAFGGRSKLIKTTGTSNKAEAMDRRLPILAQWKAEIKAAKDQKILAREQWRPALADEGTIFQQRVDASIINAVRNPSTAIGDTHDAIYARAAKLFDLSPALLSDVHHLESQGATGLVDRTRAFLQDVSTNLIDGVQGAADIAQDVMAQVAQHRYGLSPAELDEAKTLIESPATYKPVSPITAARLEKFRAYREKASVSPKTVDQQESKLDKLSDYLRDEGKKLNKETVASWIESLPLTSKTKAQYLLAGSTFWQWVIKHDARWRDDFKGADNPFKGQTLPKLRPDEKARTKRKAYTVDELSNIYLAAQSSDKGALCDLIALGYYSGARIEELAKLRKDSIITVEGVRTIDIDAAKSYAGVRQIPVHPQLAKIIDRLIEDSADGYLLKSSGGNKYGIRSDSLSKAFGRLKTSLGFGPLHVFHSVRKTTITQLLRQSIPGNVVANLVGHETGLVTFDIYDEGASPRQKLDALCKLPALKV